MSKFVILANRCFAESRLIDTKLTYFYKINKRLKSSVGNIAVEKSYKFDIQIIDIFCTAKKYSSFSRHFPCVPRSSDRVSPSCGTLRRAVAAGAGAGPAVREHPDAPALRRRLNILVRDGRIFRSVTEEETARRRRIGFRQEALRSPAGTCRQIGRRPFYPRSGTLCQRTAQSFAQTEDRPHEPPMRAETASHGAERPANRTCDETRRGSATR